ncbi:MAG: LptF/LptG family permease [Bacteroidales bacterium]|nr:LptF/LptG family permease [Bacteroidales bacterium]
MRRIHRLVITSFLGPFVMTFFIVMFLLLMQFLWKYIDELVGKGLGMNIIAELLTYASASLVPLALPLSVLLSSLMTFGGMGEHYELTAMKSSGISLRQIMMPVIILAMFISAGAFIFSNNVLPVTNLKMKSLLYDVRQQRPEFQITEGIFYNGIDNYSIRVGKKDPATNQLYDIKIYDHTDRRGNVSVIIADSGHMQMTADRRNLIITLWNGSVYSELEDDKRPPDKTYPHRTDIFREQRIVIEMLGFELMRSDESIFRNSYQMLNASQLKHTQDSLNKEISQRTQDYYDVLLQNNFFALKADGHSNLTTLSATTMSFGFPGSPQRISSTFASQQSISRSAESPAGTEKATPMPKDTVFWPVKQVTGIDILLNTYTITDRYMILEQALSNASSTMNYILSTSSTIDHETKLLRRHEIEWHRKFTLSFACLIFLFIGAPLGAIIRKGGLGMPTVISTLLFILYYIISLSGEKFARESILTSFQGMWLSSFILIIAGVFLTYEATNDSAILNLDTYYNWIRSQLGLRKNQMIEKKAYLTGKFDYVFIQKTELQNSFRYIGELAGDCREKLINDCSPGKIIRKIMENKSYDYLIELGVHYNGLFHEILLSNWFRVPYFQKRIGEFPALQYKTNHRYFSSKKFRIFSIIIFPVFIVRFIQYIIVVRKLRKKLQVIADLSFGMITLLDRSIMNIDFEDHI